MKDTFYFMLILLLFLKIFIFWPYGLVGEVTTSYARDSQFKPSRGH